MPLPEAMETSNGTAGGRTPGERTSKHKLFEEMKRKIAKYKAELEIERSKNRHFQKDKLDEIKRIREQYEYDKTTSMESYQARLQSEKHSELNKLRETLSREKDLELRQVLKYKDEEVKQLKIQFSQEKEDAVKVALEVQKKANEHKHGQIDVTNKLQKEIKHLKSVKQELEDKYGAKCVAEKEKAAQMRKMKHDHELELQRSIRETKRESLRDMNRSLVAGDGSDRGSQDNLDRKHSYSLSQSSEGLCDVDGTKDKEMGRKSASGDRDSVTGRRTSDAQPQHVSRLENRISGLKAENESLKRKISEQGPSEEKIKKLKKRNAELAAIARRLEQKVTQIQQSQQTKKPSEGSNSQDVEHMKKIFARQRAKDLAEHAKSTLAKDREVENLKKKCQELTDQLSNSVQAQQVENSQIYEDREELEYIIKQSAKERLRLERNLASRPRTTSGGSQSEADREKYQALEESNAALRRELDLAEKLTEEKEKLEVEVAQQRIECDSLYAQINEKKRKLAASEAETKRIQEELDSKTKDFDQVSDECRGLRLNLSEVEADCEAAKNNVTELRDKLSSLEALVQKLNNTAEKHKKLEKEHEDALQTLKQRQDTIKDLQAQREAEEQQHLENVGQLQTKLGDLEKLSSLQSDKNEEISRDLDHLKQQAQQLEKEKTALAQTQTQLEEEKNRITAEKKRALEDKAKILNEKEQIVKSNLLKESAEMERKARMVSVEIQTDLSGDIPPIVNGHKESRESPRQKPTPARRVSKEASRSDDVAEDDFIGADSELQDIAKKIQALAMSDSEDEINSELSDHSASQSDGSKKSSSKQSKEERVNAAARLNRSGLQVFVARYNYDPIQYSPNDNPEAELPLVAGDYVYVLGDMDEDGFFEAELINGRRGYVPSTFIEKVDEDDSFQALMALGGLPSDESQNTSLLNDLEFNSSDESERISDLPDDSPVKSSANAINLDHIVEEEPDIDTVLAGMSEQDGDSVSVSPPRKLTLDRQLSNSILVGWMPPDGSQSRNIKAYHIYVDNEFKTSIGANERTKALVEGVKAKEPHRICIRSVSSQGQSKDQQCTILVGKASPFAPSQLKASNIASTSADITWFPGNSNYPHIILVNGEEDRVVPPGVYKYSVSDLCPSTEYRITVRCKNRTSNEEPSPRSLEATSSHITFKTLPGGLPDPPVGVQVEAGPQNRTLVVTWLPVTINTAGTSNGAVVTGYIVYVDGRKVKELRNSTGDHAVVELSKLAGLPKKHVTVRTLSTNDMSHESDPAKIPTSITQLMEKTTAKTIAQAAAAKVAAKSEKKSAGMYTGASEDETDSVSESEKLEVFSPEQSAVKSPSTPTGAESPANSSPSPNPPFPTTSTPSGGSGPSVALPGGEDGNLQVEVKPDEAPVFRQVIDSSSSELSDIAEVEEEDLEDLELDLPGISDDETPALQLHPKEKSAFKPTSDLNKAQGNNDIKNRTDTDQIQPKPHDIGQNINATNMSHDAGFKTAESSSLRETVFKPVEPARSTPPTAFRTVEPKARQASLEGSPTRSNSRTPPGGSCDQKSSKPMVIPHIEITKTSSMEANSYSDEDFESYNSPTSSQSSGQKSGIVAYEPSDDRSRVRGDTRSRISSSGAKHEQREGYRDRTTPPSGDSRRTTPSSARKENPDRRDRTTPPSGGDSQRNTPPDGKNDRTQDHNMDHLSNHSSSRQDSDIVDYEDETFADGSELTLDESIVRVFIALFDYEPSLMSPNPDAFDEELPFKEGQLIKIYGDKDEDGFYRGQANGRSGYVPCNMVSEVEVEDPEIAMQLLEDSNAQLLNNTSTGDLPPMGEPSPRGQHKPDNRDKERTSSQAYGEEPVSSPRSRMSDSPRGRDVGSRPYDEETKDSPRTRMMDQDHARQDMPGSRSNGVPAMPAEVHVRRMIALYDYDPIELSPNVDADVELAFQAGELLTVFGDMDEDGFFMADLGGQRGLVPSNFLQEAPILTDEDYEDSGSVISSARSRDSFTIPEAHDREEKKNSIEKSPKKSTPKKEKKKAKEKSKSTEDLSSSKAGQAEEGKDKKKKGFFSKGKSIFKKLSK